MRRCAALLALCLLALPAVAEKPPTRYEETFTLPPQQAWEDDAWFVKGKPATVAGVGETKRWRVLIYDRENRFIGTDFARSHYKAVTWVPKYSGRFVIRVISNHDGGGEISFAVWSN